MKSEAQTLVNTSWSQTTGLPLPEKGWAASAVTSDGGLVTVGHTQSASGHADLLLTKYDSRGSVDWQQSYHHGGNSEDFGIDLALTATDEVLVCGATLADSTEDSDYLVLKYDSDGTLLWTYTYDGPAQGEDVPASIVVDGDGYAFLTGSSEGSGTGQDYATLCLNTQGQQQWLQRYDRQGFEEIAVKLILSVENQLILTGGSGESTDDWDYVSLRYERNGTLDETYIEPTPGIGFDKPADIVQDGEGNVYITGSHSTNGVDYDMLTLKLDTAFQLLWSQTHGTNGWEDQAWGIGVDSQGDVYVGGSQGSNNGNQWTVLKYSSSGSLLWDRKLPLSYAGQQGVARKVQIDAAGLVVVAGERFGAVETEIVTMGYRPNGEILWSKSHTSTTLPGEHPLMLNLTPLGTIYTQGIVLEAGVERYLTLAMEVIEWPRVYVLDSIGNPSHLAQEVLVRFDPASVILSPFQNPDILWGKAEDFIQSSVLSQMESKLGMTGSLGNASVAKVFTKMTPVDSVSITRSGASISIPPFWATLRMIIPVISSRNSPDEIEAADSLNLLQPHIWYAHPNQIGQLNCEPAGDPLYQPEQFSLFPSAMFPDGDIDVPGAWCLSVGDSSTKVGVYGQGVDWRHEDFGGNGLTRSSSKIEGGWDWIRNQSIDIEAAPDTNTHETRVAGIIGALRDNPVGVSGIAGGDMSDPMSPNRGCQLFDMRIAFWDIENFGDTELSIAIDAIVEGAAFDPNTGFGYGLNIQNHSWSAQESAFFGNGSTYSPSSLRLFADAVEFAFKNECVLVASRGNDGTTTLHYPACFQDEMVVNVGASGTNGKLKILSNGSPGFIGSFGQQMDFIAPGTSDLLHTTASGLNLYGDFNGSSAGAPHASGVAALMMSYTNQTIGVPNPLAPEDIEEILQRTTADQNNLGYDDSTGWGLLQATPALQGIEYPNYRVLHVSSETSPTTLTEEKVFGPSLIQLTTAYQGLAAGSYYGNLWKVTATIDHASQIQPSETIQDAWERNSRSEGWSGANPIVNQTTQVPFFPANNWDTQQASLVGFYFELLSGPLGTVNTWLPVHKDEARFEYTLYLRDSLLVSVEEPLPPEGVRVSVFPNPASAYVDITLESTHAEPAQLSLLNVQGQMLKQQNLRLTSQPQHVKLSVTDLIAGIYFLHIQSQSFSTYQKLIVQHP